MRRRTASSVSPKGREAGWRGLPGDHSNRSEWVPDNRHGPPQCSTSEIPPSTNSDSIGALISSRFASFSTGEKVSHSSSMNMRPISSCSSFSFCTSVFDVVGGSQHRHRDVPSCSVCLINRQCRCSAKPRHSGYVGTGSPPGIGPARRSMTRSRLCCLDQLRSAVMGEANVRRTANLALGLEEFLECLIN